MKKILPVILTALILSACDSTSIGIIGGADGPTSIVVSGKFGEQYEKRPVRMFNIDGDLYFDSGLRSDLSPRCGTMDGRLVKSANEGEIPKNSGEANFDAEGYQNATAITKEVNVDGEWVIFKKYDKLGKSTDGLKYCFYIKGHLNNAAKDSEIIVLTDNKDVTFNDVYEPLLSSQYPGDDSKGIILHNSISADEWGIRLYPENVTNTGMTIRFEQFGGNAKGSLETGSWFSLETTENDEWKPLATNPLIDFAWESIAYPIKKNDITELNVEWKWLYDELPPGYYRLSKEVMDFTSAGIYNKKIYQVHFTVE